MTEASDKTETSKAYKMANLINRSSNIHCQTTIISPTIRKCGKVEKAPSHKWQVSKEKSRLEKSDTALMIMMDDIVVIDIDTPLEDCSIDDVFPDLPADCWIDRTPSGGYHLYFQSDDDIGKYPTTTKLSLWGLDAVDILIKNGFAYGGGSAYKHPKTGKMMRYVWDEQRNPEKSLTLPPIPQEMKEEILRGLMERHRIDRPKKSNISPLPKKSIAVTASPDDLREYVLGCDGSDECAGCRGLPNDDEPYDEYFKMIVVVANETQKSDEGLEIVDKWAQRSSKYDREDVVRRYHSIKDGYDGKPLTIASIKVKSEHNKIKHPLCDLRKKIDKMDFSKFTPPPSTRLDKYQPFRDLMMTIWNESGGSKDGQELMLSLCDRIDKDCNKEKVNKFWDSFVTQELSAES